MQFPGWWVGGDQDSVTITRAIFDDTELSESSNWKKAHQNEDESLAHGFVEERDMLLEVRRRLGLLEQDAAF